MKTDYKFDPKKYINYSDFFNLEYLLKEYDDSISGKEMKVNIFSKFSFTDIDYKEKLERD
jgi:hypothetical protein